MPARAAVLGVPVDLVQPHHLEAVRQLASLRASSTTGSMLSVPSTRSSRFSTPAQSSSGRVPDPGEPLLDLGAERVVDREPVRARRLPEERVMEAIEAAELLDGTLVVVGAEVDEDVGQAGVAAVPLDDEQRRRLLAAAVASRSLGRGEAVDQALGERSPGGGRERVDHGVDRLGRDEDVPLRRVAVPRPPAGPVEALGPGERRPAARARRRLRAGAARGRRRLPSAARRPRRRKLRPAGARGRPARTPGSRTPASRSRRRAARPTAPRIRRRGTSTAWRRPTGPSRGRRHRSSTSPRSAGAAHPYVRSARSRARRLSSSTRTHETSGRARAAVISSTEPAWTTTGIAVGVGRPQRLDAADVVELERSRDVDRADESELGDLAARPSEPPFPADHSSIVSPGAGATSSMPAGSSSRSASGVPVSSPKVP